MTISFKTYLEADAPLPLIAKPQSAELQPVNQQQGHNPNQQVPTPQQPYPQNSHDDPEIARADGGASSVAKALRHAAG